MQQSIMLIAGEASGDLHGAGLVRVLKERSPEIELFGIGGSKMQGEGMEILYHADDLAFIGIAEVIKHWPTLRRIFNRTVAIARKRRPDLIVLIDYPGFNLRFARFVKRYGFKTFYYIAPQVWAWGAGRLKKMAKTIDTMAVIFQFEEQIFKSAGIDTHFVGHPLLEVVQVEMSRGEFFAQHDLDTNHPLVALLPGSRPQEIENLLPEMITTARDLLQDRPSLQFIVGKAPSVASGLYNDILRSYENVVLIEDATYAAMKYSDAAIVASGTATLETACFGTPFVIVYRVSPLSYFIMKRMIRISNIGLVNIVAGSTIVPEFVQKHCVAGNLVPVLRQLLDDTVQRHEMIQALATVKNKLGRTGASERTAELILSLI